MPLQWSFRFRLRARIPFKPNVTYLLLNSETIWLKMRVLPKRVQHHLGAFPCTDLCGLELRRVHLTCFWCVTRKTWYRIGGFSMEKERVLHPYVILIPANLGRCRRIVLRAWLSVAEFIVNIGVKP